MDTIYDAKILLVDDNAELLALLCEQLRGAGYGHIRTAQSCAAARICFAAEQPELMILDINLPDGDGFSLFRALRAKADVPALFLSARDADADRLFGLGLGADDYLTKPFLMQELLLRVQHILQRAYRAELSRTKPAPLQLVAQFCESPLAERCEITLEQEEPAEQTVLSVDEALLARLLENLLNNSVRHNPKPVNITVHTRRVGERFCLTVADDGIGYPAAVLVALNAAEPAENAPHILGLYVVQQIAAAHGGRAVFGQNTPHGAKAVVYLPLG